MIQVVLELGEEWKAEEPHHIKGSFDREIAVSPTIAKRRANAYLAGYVTMMTLPGMPSLVLNEKPVWRFPVTFNYPGKGEMGSIGTVEVDAQTGQVIPLSPEEISAVQERANVIASRLAP